MATLFPFLPENLRQNAGAGVRIALLDSGVHLQHPDLQHLLRPGFNFDTARTPFRAPDAAGSDDITDMEPESEPHGTQTAGVLAARHESEHYPTGIAHQADLYLFRILDRDFETWIDYFMNALEIAIAKDVDIIAVPYTPTIREPYNQDLLARLFQLMEAQHILLVCTQPNTASLRRLNKLKFPADHPHALVTAVLQNDMLEEMEEGETIVPAIRYVWPELNGKFCWKPAGPLYKEGVWRNSQAVTALAGLIALQIADWKQAEGDQYKRRSRTDLLQALDAVCLPYTPDVLMKESAFRPFLNRTTA
jgi:hypothetical protein